MSRLLHRVFVSSSLVWSCSGTLAFAQDVPPVPDKVTPSTSILATGQNVLPGVPQPISRPPNIGLFPAQGRSLLDAGVDIHGNFIDLFLANPSTGAIPGHTSNFAALSPAFDFDLQKLLGIPGGSAHFEETLYMFKSNLPGMIVDAGSTLAGYQTTPIVSANTLNVLTYEQKLFNNRLSVEFGKTNLYHYFFLPEGLDPFNDFSSVLNIDGNFLPLVWPIWGGRATYKMSNTWNVQGGVFEDNYEDSRRNGFHWGDAGAAGVQILLETNYQSTFADEAYPANLEIGGYWDTSPGGYNVKGTIFPSTQASAATRYRGGGAFYMQGKKVIWRERGQTSGIVKNIALYGSLNVAVDKPQPFDLDSIAGFNFTGFIPYRPADALGIQVHYARLSRIEANYETATQTEAGGLGTQMPRNGLAFEAVGDIAVTRWSALHPLAQYFTGQDNYNDPFHPNRPHDGFMAGMFLTVSLGPLLGTSRKPF